MFHLTEFYSSRIGRRLFVTLFLVAMIPLTIIGFRTYYVAQKSVEQEVFLQMEAVAGYKRILVEFWLVERLNDLTAAMHSALISSGDLKSGSPALFSDLGSNQFETVAIIADGRVLLNPGASAADSLWAASLYQLLPSKDANSTDLTIFGKTEYDPQIGTWLTILRAYPTPTGQTLVAAGKLKVSYSLDLLLADSVGLGTSGESYLIDPNGTMLTRSRFHHHPAPGTHKMSSPAIDFALAGGSGVGVYDGWTGAKTLGAWNSIKGTGWALIAEMNEAEAQAPVTRLRNEWLLISLLAFVLSAGAASFLSNSLGKPILELVGISRQVASGSFENQKRAYRSDELGDLAHEIDEMVEALERSDRSLRNSYKELLEKERQLAHSQKLASIGELVASIVHEVRNPLSSVKMNLKILSRSISSESVESQHLAIADEQVKRIEHMLDTILRYSKPIELHNSRFDVAVVLGTSIDSFRERLQGTNVEVTLLSPENLYITGDRELLTQAFENLIQNGFDVLENHSNGKIQINVTEESELEGSIKFEISDNGKGMEPDVLGRIFEPFFTTRKSGIGLGLPNVRKVIELHRGEISVHSSPGQGTTFTVILPKGRITA